MNLKRKILKTITYRIMMFVGTFIIILLLTGDYRIASAAGFLDIIVKTLLYFLHECVWGYSKEEQCNHTS
jgi:uncharacterized membrane protein